MGYPTAAELVADSRPPHRAVLEALDADQLAALHRVAIAGVEGFTRQAFTQEGTPEDPVAKLCDGSGTDSLYLPKRLAEVTGVALDSLVMQPADYALEPSGRILRITSPLGGSWVTRVRRDVTDPEPVWDVGVLNVAVAGVWGWTDADWSSGELDRVRDAIRMDMEDQASADAHDLADTIQGAQALGLSSISQGNMSLSWRAGAGSSGGGPILSSRVRRHLSGLTPSGLSLRWGTASGGAVV